MLNGDGLRVVLWVAGCNHCCRECQNPITWDPDGGLLFDEAAKQEIFEQLEKPYISGITFSGGDPMHPVNRADVRELMQEIRENTPRRRSGCIPETAGRTSTICQSCNMWMSWWTESSMWKKKM